MADVNTTTPYELLVRFKERTGEYSGSQMVYWRFRTLDDEVVIDRPNSPVAVSEADLPGLLSTINQATLASLATAQADLDTKTTENEGLQTQINTKDAEIAAKAEQITQLQQTVAAQLTTIDQLQAQIAQLQADAGNGE